MVMHLFLVQTMWFESTITLFMCLVYGVVAHLEEHLVCTEDVAGSSPVGSTSARSFEYMRNC